jgi:hypothetical protein
MLIAGLLAHRLPDGRQAQEKFLRRNGKVIKKLSIAFTICVATVLGFACQSTAESTTNMNASANSNAGQMAAATTTRTGPDNSEITTTTDASGVKTETRVFRDNPQLSTVVVTTTREGTRTARVYSPTGEEKELNKSDSRDVLEETGDVIVDAAGFVAEKTVDAAKASKEGAKKAGEKTAEGAKKVGEKTGEGAKKAGKAIKKVVTP